MSGLACATCFKFLRVTKVGVVFEEGRPIRMPMIPRRGGPTPLLMKTCISPASWSSSSSRAKAS